MIALMLREECCILSELSIGIAQMFVHLAFVCPIMQLPYVCSVLG